MWENSGGDRNGVVWVVKESYLSAKQTDTMPPEYTSSFFKVFGEKEISQRVRILSTFADEAHLAWRSSSSERSRIFKAITAMSEFNVLLSGTMFPLGPSEDARGILEHLGGEFNATSPGVSKWNRNFGKAFHRLLQSKETFSVMAFRILISHFYLRRTLNSYWEGKWVVESKIARPEPVVVLPHPDDFSHSGKVTKVTESRKRTQQTLTEIMRRADQRRFYAWTELYYEVQTKISETAGTGTSSSRERKTIEAMMMDRLPFLRPSGRVKKLIGIIKAHRQRGDRFVIVSDRLFLLQLAYYVFPTSVQH